VISTIVGVMGDEWWHSDDRWLVRSLVWWVMSDDVVSYVI